MDTFVEPTFDGSFLGHCKPKDLEPWKAAGYHFVQKTIGGLRLLAQVSMSLRRASILVNEI